MEADARANVGSGGGAAVRFLGVTRVFEELTVGERCPLVGEKVEQVVGRGRRRRLFSNRRVALPAAGAGWRGGGVGLL